MGVPGSANPLLLVQQGSTQYTVSRSLRFNSSDSAYLSRTPGSAGNRKTWTWAGWVKRSGLGDLQFLMATSIGNNTQIYFDINNRLTFTNQTYIFESQPVLRDPSAWYHFTIVLDTTAATSTNRFRVYINGVQANFVSAPTIPQNTDFAFNQTIEHNIGRRPDGYYFSGYLADIHFIDGQALDPTSFGEFDATTGVWVPKAFSGSYGTNGFRLTFSDNSGTTATTLGKDAAGSNNWTPNNFSVAAGAGNDSLVDVPTTSGTDNGNGGEIRGNYCTWNAIDKGANVNLANGNLDTSQTAAGIVRGTIGVASGKWYWEYTCAASTSNAIMIGIATAQAGLGISSVGGDAYSWGYYGVNGQKYTNNTGASYGASFTTGDVIGVALDADNGTLTFYKNGASQGQAYSGLTSGPYFPAVGTTNQNGSANFGQRPFAYPLSGFKALCTANIAEGSITTSGTFTGNANADGPFVWLNGVPTAMTINGNAVTFGTHADKLSNGFKVRSSSGSYNTAGSNSYSITTTGAKFKVARAQPNP